MIILLIRSHVFTVTACTIMTDFSLSSDIGNLYPVVNDIGIGKFKLKVVHNQYLVSSRLFLLASPFDIEF